MSKIKYDAEIMKIIQIFETVTGAKLKDCIQYDQNQRIVFIVNEGEIGKAIGKKGSNIRKLENMFNKKIRVVGFSQEVTQFVKNMIAPLQVNNVEEKEGEIIITGQDTKTKGLIIGRNKQNLNNLITMVKRYFDIQDIKVV